MSTSKKVTVYSTSSCGFCVAAKRLLDQKGVPYEEVDLGADPSLRAEIRDKYDWPTVPVILAEGELVGGYTELAKLAQSKGLDHLK